MQLHDAIAAANAQGRLGLIVYVIPNYPTPTISQEVLHLLAIDPVVSVIEMTIPVTRGFSDHANSTIVTAHHLAASFGQAWHAMLTTLPTAKPLLCVLYRASAETLGWTTLLQAFAGRIAGILPEWDEDHPAPYAHSAHCYQIEFVTCVGPWMTENDIAGHLTYATLEQPLVYLMSAPMTGAALYPATALEYTIDTVRTYRPTVKIAAGFGIRTADDIRRLATVRGLNAVIIGTAFLEHMHQGPDAVRQYLHSLQGALHHV